MANISELTRKEQVLKRLMENANEWVDGDSLANEKVGGSEGHRRLRELRSEGHEILERRHPDPGRDIWQYMLVSEQKQMGVRRDYGDEYGHAVQAAVVTPLIDPVYARGRCPVCRKVRLFTRLKEPVYVDTVGL